MASASSKKVVFADGQTNLTHGSNWHTTRAQTCRTGPGSLGPSVRRLLAGPGPKVSRFTLNYSALRSGPLRWFVPDGQSFYPGQEVCIVTGGAQTKTIATFRANHRFHQTIWMPTKYASFADPADNHFEDWLFLRFYIPKAKSTWFGTAINLHRMAGCTNKFQYLIPGGAKSSPATRFLAWFGPTNGKTGRKQHNRPGTFTSISSSI